MSEATWRKGISKQGKFPERAFSAVLSAIFPSENAKGTGLLALEFADESKIGIYADGKSGQPIKVNITEEGIEVGGSLAGFQASLEALGYACMWGTDDNNEILGFKTEPDILGMKLSMQPLEEQTVGDDTQTKKSIFWGIVTKVEAVSQKPATKQPAIQRPGKLPKAPKTQEPAASTDKIAGELIDMLMEAHTIGEIYEMCNKKYKPGELRDALKLMKDQGTVLENGQKWQVT